MNSPKVAIIIPNYNKEKYIVECIDSAVNQTYKNIEIIIIDDHSTDHSDAVIKKAIKNLKNVKYYRLPKNHGVSYARNFGASKTDADFLVFLDSDDIYKNKQKIEKEVKIAKTNKVAFSQWVPVDVKGKTLEYKTYKVNPLRFFAISKVLSIALPPYKQLRGYLIPTNIFREIGGYNTNLSLYEDFDLQCRLALKTKFVYTKSTGEAYRLGTGGLSSQSVENAQKAIEKVRKKYYKELNLFEKVIYNYYLRKK